MLPKAKKPQEETNQTLHVIKADFDFDFDGLEKGAAAQQTQQAKGKVAALLLACSIGGLLSALWSPVSVWAFTQRNLGAYECLFFFNFGQLIVIPFILIQAYRTGVKLEWGTPKQRVIVVCAGFINVGGFIAMFIAGEAASFAMAFGILQCSPLVAAMWGLYQGEMRGANMPRVGCFVAMMIMYSVAIAVITGSQV